MSEKRTHKAGEKRTHMPKPGSRNIVDYCYCSCGWESRGYWDGMELALQEWIAHQAEVGVR